MTPCEACGGLCCRGLILHIKEHYPPDEWRWICLHGRETLDGVEFTVPCNALREGRCSIYPIRPKVCQDYKVGGESCLSVIAKLAPEKLPQVVNLIIKSRTAQN